MRHLAGLLLISAVAWALEPTYHRHVAPVLKSHCVSCHKPGEMGPFPLTTYEEARQAGPQMHSAIRARRMPPDEKSPYHAPDFYAKTMRRHELSTIVRWVEAGMPEGEKRKK